MNRPRNPDVYLPYLYVMPSLVLMGLLLFFPIARNAFISFFEWGVHTGSKPFVGFQNYVDLIGERWFFRVLLNTFVWTIIGVGLQLLLGLGFTLALDETSQRYGKIHRFVLLVPWVLPGVIVALMWRWMLQADLGVFNQLLIEVGLIDTPILWLSEDYLALPAAIIANTWKATPFWIIMLTAQLVALPDELVQAARIDGASNVQLIRYIKLPHLWPTVVSVGVLVTIWTFKFFDMIWIMTRGGPGVASTTLTVQTYRIAFENFRFGRSAAMGMITLFILMIFSIPYIRNVRNEV